MVLKMISKSHLGLRYNLKHSNQDLTVTTHYRLSLTFWWVHLWIFRSLSLALYMRFLAKKSAVLHCAPKEWSEWFLTAFNLLMVSLLNNSNGILWPVMNPCLSGKISFGFVEFWFWSRSIKFSSGLSNWCWISSNFA